MIDASTFTVGPLRENCYVVRGPHAETAVVVDPGDEPERLLAGIRELGVTRVDAILITHCHFDHVGAVKALRDATGAPVYCPEGERHILADIDAHISMGGFGGFESVEADHVVSGGEALELAGLTFDVRLTPGHSVGHVSYHVRDEGTLISGDVLFQGSVGRVDLPGGDWPTLRASIAALLDEFPPETVVLPGHMGRTTLGAERASNPFLRDLVSP